jgi:hypothetical protein
MDSSDFRLSKPSFDKLADRHIAMYEHRLAQLPNEYINEGECRRYLAIWQHVKAAPNWDALDPIAKGEIIDAVCEGSYSDCLTAEEIASLPDVWDDA